MKSHIKHPRDRVCVTEKQIHKAVEAKVDDIRLDIYKAVVQDISVQTLATVLKTLETCYGWKEQRLKQFIQHLHDTEDLMVNPSPLHHRFTHLDNERYMRETYNINLEKEFPAHVETKNERK